MFVCQNFGFVVGTIMVMLSDLSLLELDLKKKHSQKFRNISYLIYIYVVTELKI